MRLGNIGKCRGISMFKNFTMPKTCGECKFIGHYEEGIWSRNPHCCCELRFDLYDEDYKVDKDSMDENCPLKDLEDTSGGI